MHGRQISEAIGRYIDAPNLRYHCGWRGDALAGVVAMRDRRHLFPLFVAPACQRHGIACLPM